MSLALPTASSSASDKNAVATSSSDKDAKDEQQYGKTGAPPIRPPASVPEITAVQGLVPVLQWVLTLQLLDSG